MDHFKAVFEKINLIKSNEERIARMSGNNFNIFKVLGLSSDENRLHSAFIAELLDPKGSHAQSDLFLTLFIQNVYPEKFRDFDTKNATVITEHHFSGNGTGRIDILISESQVQNS